MRFKPKIWEVGWLLAALTGSCGILSKISAGTSYEIAFAFATAGFGVACLSIFGWVEWQKRRGS